MAKCSSCTQVVQSVLRPAWPSLSTCLHQPTLYRHACCCSSGSQIIIQSHHRHLHIQPPAHLGSPHKQASSFCVARATAIQHMLDNALTIQPARIPESGNCIVHAHHQTPDISAPAQQGFTPQCQRRGRQHHQVQARCTPAH